MVARVPPLGSHELHPSPFAPHTLACSSPFSFFSSGVTTLACSSPFSFFSGGATTSARYSFSFSGAPAAPSLTRPRLWLSDRERDDDGHPRGCQPAHAGRHPCLRRSHPSTSPNLNSAIAVDDEVPTSLPSVLPVLLPVIRSLSVALVAPNLSSSIPVSPGIPTRPCAPPDPRLARPEPAPLDSGMPAWSLSQKLGSDHVRFEEAAGGCTIEGNPTVYQGNIHTHEKKFNSFKKIARSMGYGHMAKEIFL
ncbi:hypothetical protein PR202_gb07859 [Eleusine coracana subsp. coracana]|uniref:Uncharacterized protein n=1 Tax=Eleusine coracana subsp. coracana TaxID=191504 RepID=A0AAV5ECN1_ELECO|nr:hypothetical protein PR202_gb07859 [Eleusine coracana subsp. coracana]